MSFLLDTNICSAHMKRPSGLIHRFIQYSGRLWIPSVVLAELFAGAHMLNNPTPLLRRIEDLLADVQILDFDQTCAEEFGKLRGVLKRLGATMAPIDLMIASVALVHGLTLVTNNTADFRHIPGLQLEDWLTP